MDELMLEAINTVDKLNDEMIDHCEEGSDFTWVLLSLIVGGGVMLIKFLDLTIWFSEEDEREYIAMKAKMKFTNRLKHICAGRSTGMWLIYRRSSYKTSPLPLAYNL
jgi:arginine deiminase